MKFEYGLTEQQYRRFVDDPNTTGEIDNLARVLGTNIAEADPIMPNIAMQWTFSGSCVGAAYLYKTPRAIRIDVTRKPWYIPNFVLDWGFREALK